MPIHQLYATHCTLQTSALARGGKSGGPGYGPRAGSLKGADLAKFFQRVEPLLYYELPHDTPAAERLTLTADRAPRRLLFHPDADGWQVIGLVCYRARDASGGSGSYFAHILAQPLEGKPRLWTPLDALRLWNAPGWVMEDQPTLPFDLPALISLTTFLGGKRAVDDRVLFSFITTPANGNFDDPAHTIPPDWRAKSPAERRQLLQQLLSAFLELDRTRYERLLLACEPSLAALLYYGVLRLVPEPFLAGVRVSTFDGVPQAQATLSATTVYDPRQTFLPDAVFRGKGMVIDTYQDERTKPRRPQAKYPAFILDTLNAGNWIAVDDLLQSARGTAARTPDDLEKLLLPAPATTPPAAPAPAPAPTSKAPTPKTPPAATKKRPSTPAIPAPKKTPPPAAKASQLPLWIIAVSLALAVGIGLYKVVIEPSFSGPAPVVADLDDPSEAPSPLPPEPVTPSPPAPVTPPDPRPAETTPPGTVGTIINDRVLRLPTDDSYAVLLKSGGHPDLNKPFTIEMLVRWPEVPITSQVLASCYKRPDEGETPVSASGWELSLIVPVASTKQNAQLRLKVAKTPSQTDALDLALAKEINGPKFEPVAGQWYHIAVTRSPGTPIAGNPTPPVQIRIWLDGKSEGDAPFVSLPWTSGKPAEDLWLGKSRVSPDLSLTADIRGIRISDFVRDFTSPKPAGEFVLNNNGADGQTVLAYDFRNGVSDEDEVLKLENDAKLIEGKPAETPTETPTEMPPVAVDSELNPDQVDLAVHDPAFTIPPLLKDDERPEYQILAPHGGNNQAAIRLHGINAVNSVLQNVSATSNGGAKAFAIKALNDRQIQVSLVPASADVRPEDLKTPICEFQLDKTNARFKWFKPTGADAEAKRDYAPWIKFLILEIKLSEEESRLVSFTPSVRMPAASFGASGGSIPTDRQSNLLNGVDYYLARGHLIVSRPEAEGGQIKVPFTNETPPRQAKFTLPKLVEAFPFLETATLQTGKPPGKISITPFFFHKDYAKAEVKEAEAKVLGMQLKLISNRGTPLLKRREALTELEKLLKVDRTKVPKAPTAEESREFEKWATDNVLEPAATKVKTLQADSTALKRVANKAKTDLLEQCTELHGVLYRDADGVRVEAIIIGNPSESETRPTAMIPTAPPADIQDAPSGPPRSAIDSDLDPDQVYLAAHEPDFTIPPLPYKDEQPEYQNFAPHGGDRQSAIRLRGINSINAVLLNVSAGEVGGAKIFAANSLSARQIQISLVLASADIRPDDLKTPICEFHLDETYVRFKWFNFAGADAKSKKEYAPWVKFLVLEIKTPATESRLITFLPPVKLAAAAFGAGSGNISMDRMPDLLIGVDYYLARGHFVANRPGADGGPLVIPFTNETPRQAKFPFPKLIQVFPVLENASLQSRRSSSYVTFDTVLTHQATTKAAKNEEEAEQIQDLLDLTGYQYLKSAKQAKHPTAKAKFLDEYHKLPKEKKFAALGELEKLMNVDRNKEPKPPKDADSSLFAMWALTHILAPAEKREDALQAEAMALERAARDDNRQMFPGGSSLHGVLYRDADGVRVEAIIMGKP